MKFSASPGLAGLSRWVLPDELRRSDGSATHRVVVSGPSGSQPDTARYNTEVVPYALQSWPNLLISLDVVVPSDELGLRAHGSPASNRLLWLTDELLTAGRQTNSWRIGAGLQLWQRCQSLKFTSSSGHTFTSTDDDGADAQPSAAIRYLT